MAKRTSPEPDFDPTDDATAYDSSGTTSADDIAYAESGGTARTKPARKSGPGKSASGKSASGKSASGKRASGKGRPQPTSKWKLLGYTALGLVGALLLGWFTGILAGKAFGPDEPKPRASASTSSEAKATGEGSTPGESIAIANAALFDPPPGDGQENADRINLSYDGQPGTTWPTLQYKATASFGNIKPGVGIIYDLGAEKSISQVKITTTLPGATVEIRTGPGTTGTLDQFPMVAGPVELQTNTDIPLPAGTKAQYVLVWITKLVPQQGFFQASLSEVSIIS